MDLCIVHIWMKDSAHLMQGFCMDCAWSLSAWMMNESASHSAWQWTGSQVWEIRRFWRKYESVEHGPCPRSCMSGLWADHVLVNFLHARFVRSSCADGLISFAFHMCGKETSSVEWRKVCGDERAQSVGAVRTWCSCQHMLAYARIFQHMLEYAGIC